jgi:hypothetical protein
MSNKYKEHGRNRPAESRPDSARCPTSRVDSAFPRCWLALSRNGKSSQPIGTSGVWLQSTLHKAGNTACSSASWTTFTLDLLQTHHGPFFSPTMAAEAFGTATAAIGLAATVFQTHPLFSSRRLAISLVSDIACGRTRQASDVDLMGSRERD